MTPTCRHLHTDGRPCGSPALRGEPFCFHHHTARKSMPQRDRGPFAGPQLPAPDDFLAIQRGLGEVLRLLALDKLTDRRAQTLLNGLAKASTNLARHYHREEKIAAQAIAQGRVPAQPVTAFVNDPYYGTLAPDPSQTTEQAAAPVPDPIPLLTPDPSRETTYDIALAVEIHHRLEAIFRQQTQAFEAAKEAELEARFEALCQDRSIQYAHQREDRLDRQYHPEPSAERQTQRQIPTQTNQYLRTKTQKRLNAPTQAA